MNPFALALVLAGMLAPQPQPAGADVRRLTISSPQTLRRLDAAAVPGTPIRLSPSSDGTWVYVRTSEVDRWANEKIHHLLVAVRGNEITSVEAEPNWASGYWLWKSAREAPGRPDLRIGFETRAEQLRTTNVPREGGIGQAMSDPNESLDEVVRRAAWSNQRIMVDALSLHGRVIGRAINQYIVPGRTFGWAPAPSALIAYANEKGRLVLMDDAGRIREIRGTKDVSLPAWSEDGGKLLFLQRAGKRFELRAIDVR